VDKSANDPILKITFMLNKVSFQGYFLFFGTTMKLMESRTSW